MKTYYKFRPRNGETVIHYDMTHSSGVIVDGHLTFPKEDGTPFVATFEATSVSSSAEVLYRLQRQRLQWDAIAGGATFTFLLMFCLWTAEARILAKAELPFSILLSLCSFILSFLAYQMFYRSGVRYRYIYAIEQFKQYHVDEQWIALGNDVFNDPLDPFFTELKQQCVKNGFGLLTVDKDEHVNLLITPAREEVFNSKRKALTFQGMPSITTNLQRLSTPSIERYARSFWTQIAITSVAFMALNGVFYRSWQARPVEKINETAYQDSMKREAARLDPNRETASQYVFKAEDIVKAESLKTYDATVVSNPSSQNNNVGLYVFSVQDGYISYECERIDMHGTRYVVQDLTFNNFNDAKRRIEHLKTYGLIANAISLDCTVSATSKHDYCVYYEVIFNDEKSANSKAIEIKGELERMHLKHDFIKIRVLNFQNY